MEADGKRKHIGDCHRAKWKSSHQAQVEHLRKFRRHLQESGCLAGGPCPLAPVGAISWLEMGSAGPVCVLTLVSFEPTTASTALLLLAICCVVCLRHYCCCRVRDRQKQYKKRELGSMLLSILNTKPLGFLSLCVETVVCHRTLV